MFYEPRLDDHGLPHDPLYALVVPRPIGWISTRSAQGALNLAPYSFFNLLHDDPPIVAFSSAGAKDSAAFAMETGEFVVNVVSEPLAAAMNATSVNAARGESEFALAGLTPAPCRLVAAPRVAETYVALECKVSEVLRPRSASGESTEALVVLGEVVGVHLDERVLSEGKVDVHKLLPVARLGYDQYTTVRETFAMKRPRRP